MNALPQNQQIIYNGISKYAMYKQQQQKMGSCYLNHRGAISRQFGNFIQVYSNWICNFLFAQRIPSLHLFPTKSIWVVLFELKPIVQLLIMRISKLYKIITQTSHYRKHNKIFEWKINFLEIENVPINKCYNVNSDWIFH